MDDNKRIREKNFNIGYFIVSFMLLFSLSFVVRFFIEKEIRQAQFETLKANEQRIVKLENAYLGKEVSLILSDLHYLHLAFEEQLTDPSSYNKVAQNWLKFSAERQIYDQIRFIDISGKEKIRINFDDNQAYIVSQDKLQNKKDRYYFYESIDLADGYVHISPMDLNIEQNEVEVPFKPMLRFATPVYDNNGKVIGIVILNYLAENMLSGFKEIGLNSQGEIMLLNASGYWLSNQDERLEWAFMFDENKALTFKNKFATEWSEIYKEEDKGQLITSNGLFTYTPVNLQHKIAEETKNHKDVKIVLSEGNWYVVSSISRTGKQKSLFTDNNMTLVLDVLKQNSLYFAFVLFISLMVASLIYLNRRTYSRIKYYSEYDTLTKVYSRRAGIERLNALIPQDDRRRYVISLCFIDVNGLKQVNDILGHKYGDELIVSVVKVIKETIREYDFVVRMGGDEFLIVFNGIGQDGAEAVWKRIAERYEAINNSDEHAYLLSVSHGIVSRSNLDKSAVDELIKLADEKMYDEKRVIKSTLGSVIK
jgi:diguanylate cyclase (GGDEF)-like protein